MRRLLAVLFLAALGLAIASPRAFAHASLRSSDPSNGARLDAAPVSVSLTFTEPPEESLSRVEVLDSSGESWDQGEPSVADGDERTLQVQVDDLDDGVYTVTWRTVSKVDGHASSGVVAFGVGVDPTGAPTAVPIDLDATTDAPTYAVEIVGRWIFLVGLVFLLGAAVIGAGVIRDWSGGIRRLGEAAAAVAAVGLVVLAVGQLRVAEVPLGDFLDTNIGRAVLWRLAGVGLAVAGLIAARGQNAAVRIGLGAAAVGAAVAMLVHVKAGHAAADQAWSWAKVGAQWLHFLAAGVWVGGLAGLIAGTRGAAGEHKAAAVRRFSGLAAVMLVAVALSGIFRAINEVDGWGALFTTGYGQVVLVKIWLLLCLLTLGAINRYRSVPAASKSLTRLRKVSGVELGVAGAALLAAAILATLNPTSPEEATAAPRPQGVVVSGSDFATSVRARLEVTPGGAGLNVFSLELTDYDTSEPVDAERVSLAFTYAGDTGVARSELELTPAGPGEYRTEGTNLSLSGRWEVIVVVERGAESVEVPLQVATRCDAREEAEPGVEPVWVMPVAHDVTAEAWVEPGAAGANEVHLTYFAGSGNEARIARAPTIVGTTADGNESEFDVRRFGPGHFVATGQLEEGEWRFDFNVALHGQRTQTCFEEAISAAE